MQICVMNQETGRDRYYKTWHAAPTHMLIWFQSDGGSLVLSDGVYEIRRGTLCFVAAGSYHYTMPEEPENYVRSKLFFPANFFEKTEAYLDNAGILAEFAGRNALCARLPRELWAQTDSLFAESGESELAAVSAILKLLERSARYADMKTGPAEDIAAVAVDFINRRIQDPITVDDICGAVHMSKYHFCRRFKAMTGLTPMAYVQQTRLALAKDMLRRTEESVLRISEGCGFGSQAHFCRVFRQATGMSPLQYRKQKR